jgi:ActR/RegA family two-component response regulator
MQDHLYARTTERWLGKRGWRLTRAEGLNDAIERLGNCDAAVALIDLDDDGISGFALLSAVRKLNRACRVVICTRDASLTSLPLLTRQRLGIVELVLRPCHLDVVLAALERAATVALAAEEKAS